MGASKHWLGWVWWGASGSGFFKTPGKGPHPSRWVCPLLREVAKIPAGRKTLKKIPNCLQKRWLKTFSCWGGKPSSLQKHAGSNFISADPQRVSAAWLEGGGWGKKVLGGWIPRGGGGALRLTSTSGDQLWQIPTNLGKSRQIPANRDKSRQIPIVFGHFISFHFHFISHRFFTKMHGTFLIFFFELAHTPWCRSLGGGGLPNQKPCLGHWVARVSVPSSLSEHSLALE